MVLPIDGYSGFSEKEATPIPVFAVRELCKSLDLNSLSG